MRAQGGQPAFEAALAHEAEAQCLRRTHDHALPCARAHTHPRCVAAGQYEQAIGVALEGRRLDKLEAIVGRVQPGPERTRVIKYALRVCTQLIVSRAFRQQVGHFLHF